MTKSDFAERDRSLFNAIAEKYAAKDLQPAHRYARRHRLEQTFSRLPTKADIAILEVGCGAGFGAAYLEGRYRSYLGIDYASELIRYANEVNKRPGASFETCDVEALGKERKFDIVFMIGVLHHLDKPASVLGQMRDVLKPGGWFLANEPQRGNPVVGAARAIRKRTDAAYSADQREYSASELVELYKQAGFVDILAFSQGLLSTPFAEVMMPAPHLASALSKASCAADRVLNPIVGRLAWNIVVQGRRPD